MSIQWKWWRKRAEARTPDKIDAWVRSGLEVEVPAGSFDQVWAQVHQRLEQDAAPEIPPWELLQDLRRLRWWVRGLGAASVGMAILLVVLLLKNVAPEPGTDSRLRASGPQVGMAPAASKKKVLSWLPSPADQERAITESYGLLQDNRVIYSSNLKGNGGR
ncbi:MAG: hypothetical protein IT369_16960 [Candidatus Latescibacteria bacterium]|nr:hypothetical protein [Candidatus Latescibacterota bacterium]